MGLGRYSTDHLFLFLRGQHEATSLSGLVARMQKELIYSGCKAAGQPGAIMNLGSSSYLY